MWPLISNSRSTHTTPQLTGLAFNTRFIPDDFFVSYNDNICRIRSHSLIRSVNVPYVSMPGNFHAYTQFAVIVWDFQQFLLLDWELHNVYNSNHIACTPRVCPRTGLFAWIGHHLQLTNSSSKYIQAIQFGKKSTPNCNPGHSAYTIQIPTIMYFVIREFHVSSLRTFTIHFKPIDEEASGQHLHIGTTYHYTSCFNTMPTRATHLALVPPQQMPSSLYGK